MRERSKQIDKRNLQVKEKTSKVILSYHQIREYSDYMKEQDAVFLKKGNFKE